MATQTASPRTRKASTKVARLHRHEDTGTIHALSSDGVTRYAVVNTAAGEWACTCPGYVNHGHCYHSAEAARRFTGFHRILAVIVPATEPEPPTTPAAPALARPAPVETKLCVGCCTMRPVAELVPPARTAREYGTNPDGRGVRGSYHYCQDWTACHARQVEPARPQRVRLPDAIAEGAHFEAPTLRLLTAPAAGGSRRTRRVQVAA